MCGNTISKEDKKSDPFSTKPMSVPSQMIHELFFIIFFPTPSNPIAKDLVHNSSCDSPTIMPILLSSTIGQILKKIW